MEFIDEVPGASDEFIPGPLGVKIDDSSDSVKVTLAVPGIKPGFFGIGKNTTVDLKLEEQSLRVLIEVRKKSKPEKCMYAVKRLPEKIDPEKSSHELKANSVVLTLFKQTQGSWANILDQSGLETAEN